MKNNIIVTINMKVIIVIFYIIVTFHCFTLVIFHQYFTSTDNLLFVYIH